MLRTMRCFYSILALIFWDTSYGSVFLTGFVLASADSVAASVPIDTAAARAALSSLRDVKPASPCLSVSEDLQLLTTWRACRPFSSRTSLSEFCEHGLRRHGSSAIPHR